MKKTTIRPLDSMLTESKYNAEEWHPILYSAMVQWESHHSKLRGLDKERRLYELGGNVISHWKSNRTCGLMYLVSLLKDMGYTEAVLACNYLQAHAIRQRESQEDFQYLPYLPTFMENQPWRFHPIPVTSQAEKRLTEEVRWIRSFISHLQALRHKLIKELAEANEQSEHNKLWLKHSESADYKPTEAQRKADMVKYQELEKVSVNRLKCHPEKIESIRLRINNGYDFLNDIKFEPFASVKHGKILRLARKNIKLNIEPKSYQL